MNISSAMIHNKVYNGLLPTPNSPILHNGSPLSYVKPSYFPIPYAAVVIIEEYNISSTPTWDISVNKSLKVKIQWDFSNSYGACVFGNVVPKALFKAVSSYNLQHHSWSTSIQNNKISLQITWSLSQSLNPPNIPSTTPRTPGLSQSRYANDSGYSSNYTRSPNRSYSSGLSPIQQPVFPSPHKPSKRNEVWVCKTSQRSSASNTINERDGPDVSTPNTSPNLSRSRVPASRLDFSSPRKNSGRHDIYRPSPTSQHQTSPIHETKVDTVSSNTKHPPKPVIPNTLPFPPPIPTPPLS